MKRILILDDDLELCELLVDFLTREGFVAQAVHRPEEAFAEVFERSFDLFVIDVMLPVMNGFDVLKHVRSRSRVPIIMLTARGGESDRIRGLELGADDYLPKPFNPRELLARIKAIFRRSEPSLPVSDAGELLQDGDLKLHLTARKAFRGNEELHLTAVEFNLLEHLVRSTGQVLKRRDLALLILGRPLEYDDRSLDVHVCNLRKKIGDPSQGGRIQTIRGVGYVFSPSVSSSPNTPSAS